MEANRVKELRLKRNLTQAALAKMASTSQQHIARIEKGLQLARLDLAGRICEALGAPLNRVFPAAARPARSFTRMAAAQRTEAVLSADGLASEFRNAGVDVDPRIWTLKLRLSNGTTHFLNIDSGERARIERLLTERDARASFVVFDSDDRRVVLNMDEVVYAHFLYEPFFQEHLASTEEERQGDASKNEESSAIVHLVAPATEPLYFTVERDRYVAEDEGELGEFGTIFWEAELPDANSTPSFGFTDADGEWVHLRPKSVAMLSVPLWVVEDIDILPDGE